MAAGDITLNKEKVLHEREETNGAVNEFYKLIADKQELLNNIRKLVPVLVLSCDLDLRAAVKKRLLEKGYAAFTIDEVKNMFPGMPEHEMEKSAIEWVRIIIAIEDSRIDETYKCPGLVQECTIIMGEANYQNKVIYVCPTTVPKSTIRDVTTGHYVYFPNIEQIDYSHEMSVMADEIFSITKKEIHRITFGMMKNHNTEKWRENNLCAGGEI